MLMNHSQVQCPENKDRNQKTEVKDPCIYSFSTHGVPTAC